MGSNVMAIRPPEELRQLIKERAKQQGFTVNACVLDILWDYFEQKPRRCEDDGTKK